ncbi:uncharacterized protein BYT42DRAFT_544619 [Radiomyces spectabilis]|uniref:uncharacterized protein n=1 Tax=Radiomyces spectabilis TaxID=64574 RepID=UPI00221E7F2B|nr:uncharacterized protein BYT42DRAFT_544619 [Radiomyces spectabilis]KAI8384773.1 hypothetical protein BYT42DRAFT_544619 [Radiomyces spectabilis]
MSHHDQDGVAHSNLETDHASPSTSLSPDDRSQKRTSDDAAITRERKSRKSTHELLTDAEKKANHIASEQKRRQNIRLGFDQLIEIVPSLNSGNRSEAIILQKSVDHIKQLIANKSQLKEQIKELEILLGDPHYDDDASIV